MEVTCCVGCGGKYSSVAAGRRTGVATAVDDVPAAADVD